MYASLNIPSNTVTEKHYSGEQHAKFQTEAEVNKTPNPKASWYMQTEEGQRSTLLQMIIIKHHIVKSWREKIMNKW